MKAPLARRVELAERIRAARAAVAEAATDEFLRRHPDWIDRYGARARRLGEEDAGYHLDFLAGAIESGSLQAFRDYADWSTRVLAARGIEARFLAENVGQIGSALVGRLSESERAMLAGYLEAFRERALAPRAPGEHEEPEPRGALGAAASVFLQALLAGDRRAASTIALESARDHALADVYGGVLQDSLYRIGGLWESNRISVAQEHVATAIVQFVLVQLYSLQPLAARDRGRVVITGVEGELHHLGANMVSDLLELHGWDVRFVGSNVPERGVVEIVRGHTATVVGVSATMLHSVPWVRRLIAALRAAGLPERPRIVLGGAAFRSAPDLPAELGADGVAFDLSGAVALFDRLAPR